MKNGPSRGASRVRARFFDTCTVNVTGRIGGGARGGSSPWRPPRRSTYPCGCWGSPYGASAGRTAGRFARASLPRRRPSGCRTWPASMGLEACQASLVNRRARATKGWKEAYLEAREHLILRFGPRSTLEVDVIGHERWVWGRERGEGRAMRCVFCGVARGEASVMTFFARSAWGTSLEIFFSPNRNLPGVRFSQIAHHQPAAAREICCSAEGERRVVC